MESLAGRPFGELRRHRPLLPDVVIRNRIVGRRDAQDPTGCARTARWTMRWSSPNSPTSAGFCAPTCAKAARCSTPTTGRWPPLPPPWSRLRRRGSLPRLFAHTLGTELGTGWILPDGSIPEIPLEVYNFIVDLGSFGQRAYDPDDARSILNVNTALSGTLQKCACQHGVFRLGAKYLPERDPQTYARLFERGLFVRDGECLRVPTAPVDMRKACLEFFMGEAQDPPPPSARRSSARWANRWACAGRRHSTSSNPPARNARSLAAW